MNGKHAGERYGGRLPTLAAMVVVCWLGVVAAQADTTLALDPMIDPIKGPITVLPWPGTLTEPITVSVATDKAAYVPGELLLVDITAYNPNDFDITLDFSSSLQAEYTMDSVYTNPQVAYQAFTNVTIPANGSYTWSQPHLWSDYDLGIGTHEVVGRVVGRGTSQPYAFDVIAPTLPTSDLTIDFEHLPDGRDLVNSLGDEYAAWGVHFHEARSGLPEAGRVSVHRSDDNQYAAAVSCTYPPGFNIVADFDMSVHGISADVSSAAGMTVTMVAKDADGEIIASVESDVIAAYQEFVTVSLDGVTKDRPIASVEWYASQENAAVFVDNIHLSLPEPATLALLVPAGLVMLRRGRKGRGQARGSV